MRRDIDEIIERVERELPGVKVSEYKCTDGTADEGIWWFSNSGDSKTIQIESASGTCPFSVETDKQCRGDALRASSVTEAVRLVVEYLKAASNGRSVTLTGERFWN